MLAAHVVGGAEALAERRPPQRPAAGRRSRRPRRSGSSARRRSARNRSGGSALGHVRREPALDAARSIPSGAVAVSRRCGSLVADLSALLGHRRRSICPRPRRRPAGRLRRRADHRHLDELRRLLRAARGSTPRRVKRLFREDPEALADLRALETGGSIAAGVRAPLRGAARAPRPRGADRGPVRRPGARRADARGGPPQARRAGIPTGLISNSWVMDHYDRRLIGELFDVVVISAEVGLHKPQPEIYLLAAERLGLEPADCVFVDDLRENCDGAEAVGMTAVLHRDADATIAAWSACSESSWPPDSGGARSSAGWAQQAPDGILPPDPPLRPPVPAGSLSTLPGSGAGATGGAPPVSPPPPPPPPASPGVESPPAGGAVPAGGSGADTGRGCRWPPLRGRRRRAPAPPPPQPPRPWPPPAQRRRPRSGSARGPSHPGRRPSRRSGRWQAS